MHYKLNNSVDRWLDRLIDRYFNYIFLDKKRKHEHGSGFCTVFILDTSETMAGEGLHQMKKALWDILDGKSELLIFCAVKGIKKNQGKQNICKYPRSDVKMQKSGKSTFNRKFASEW